MPKRVWELAKPILACIFLLFGIEAGRAAADTSRSIVDTWGIEEGLPQSSVITLIQSRDGYLWFGTLNGFVRFDGIRFAIFDESNTPGLNSSRIVKLFEDSRGDFFIGTETAGAALAKDGQIRSLNLGQGRREGMLKSICEDSLGAVWLYTADGELARYHEGKVDVWTLPSNAVEGCRAVIAEQSGTIWVGQDQFLFPIDPKEVRNGAALPQAELVRVRKLDFLLASKRGGHWRLVDGYVQRWVNQRVESSWPYPWSTLNKITAACEDRNGNLIVGAKGEGVFQFDADGKSIRISKENGLSDNSILSLHADNEGSLWVGLDGGGLNRVKQSVFKILEESLGTTVQSVQEDEHGALWISSNEGGIARWKDGVYERVNSSYGPMNTFNVRPLFLDRNQTLWAGTFGAGLFQWQNDLFRPQGIGAVNLRISALLQDRAGRLWVGTQQGLACFDQGTWTNWTTKNGLSANIVRAIAEDSEGTLWIGTERGGLNRFQDGKFSVFQQSNGFPSDNISSLLADKQGVLWVGTIGSGLVRFQNGKWTHYTTAQGLTSNGIDYLIEDDQGCLWIGSNTGLIRVRKKALNDFANGKMNFIPCRRFGKQDGLPASECTLGSQPAACRTKAGHLWFPTIAGLAGVDPSRFSLNPNPPPVLIESVFVEGQKQNADGFRVKLPKEITISPGKEHLEIRYGSLSLAAPNSARFKYRLTPHEEAWVEAGDNRVAHYPPLPPGDYRFQVTACNEDGIWNETGDSIAVIVLPPFWRTWWFLALTAMALVGIVVTIVHFVSTQKLQRQLESLRQKEALEKERARIARDIHDQVGASLTQVSLLGEMLESDKADPVEVENHARQISQTARETAHALDEIVWTVNPSNDTLEGLINYICKNAQEYLAVAELRFRLEVPSQLPQRTISPEARHNAFLAAKEAVTNIVRHANASEAWLRLRLEPSQFTLEIEDNGRGPVGMSEARAQSRNGLSNMRKRMEDIGGTFVIGERPGGGTRVSLTVPMATK